MVKLKMYEVAAHHELGKLIQLVNMFVDDGWEIVGPVVIPQTNAESARQPQYFQTLQKKT